MSEETTTAPEPRKPSRVPGAVSRPESDETQQLRAEVALLRALVQDRLDRDKLNEADKKEQAEFLAWIGLPTQQKTQMVADRLFTRAPGDEIWEVELQEQPKVRLPAHSEYEAIGRYNQLCGITGTAHKHTAIRLSGELVGV